MVWAMRLAGFLLFRILRSGKDDRFDQMRDKFLPFLGFWCFQILWVWTVSLPVTVLNSPNVQSYPQIGFGTGRDIAGVVLFAIGFVMESVSDLQRLVFRERNKDNKAAICDTGFFYVSRHPNYFGEIIIQFGMRDLFFRDVLTRLDVVLICVIAIYMIAVSPAADGYVGGQAFKALYATIFGPILLTLMLMLLSGLTLSERPGAKKRYENGQNWEEYKQYLNRTSILIPFPPQLYEHLPTILKRTVFLEFPIYVFDPSKHSDIAKPVENSQGRPSQADERQSADNAADVPEQGPSR